MQKRIQIGLVGDFSEKMYTHVALNESVSHCKTLLHFNLEVTWLPTETITDTFLAKHSFNGFWIAPGSPYNNDAGVYAIIKWSRENNIPLLGTCGGFQYMVVEFARNFLGLDHVGHEESDPHLEKLVISRLSCSLKGKQEIVSIVDHQSWLYEVLRKDTITGFFNCSYGVTPFYTKLLNQYPMVFTAFSQTGEPRALELKAHQFYCATLFQPSLDSTKENPNPLLLSFFNKCSRA